jgi:hypothetical protein
MIDLIGSLYFIGRIIGGDFAKFCGLLRIYELYDNIAESARVEGNKSVDFDMAWQILIYSRTYLIRSEPAWPLFGRCGSSGSFRNNVLKCAVY